MVMDKPKDPKMIDKLVGQKIRQRRLMLGMSQEKLGLELGLTFQQVQKYEKGTNRISAGRLAQIASILGVPLMYFFPEEGAIPASDESKIYEDFMSTQDAITLNSAFLQIESKSIRKAIIELCKAAT